MKKLLQKIFSIKNEEDNKVFTVFGFKIKFFNAKKCCKDLCKKLNEESRALKKTKSELKTVNQKLKTTNQELIQIKNKDYLQAYRIMRFFGATDELMSWFKLPKQLGMLRHNGNNKIWLVYIMCLLQRQEIGEALEVLKEYSFCFGNKNIELYPPISHFAHKNSITNELIEKSALAYDAILNSSKNKVLEKMLKNKTIAVVGNGPSEIGKNKGVQIDNHDIVIRFNNFVTNGYENDYGSKTDIWCCNLMNDIERRDERFKMILLPESVNVRESTKYQVFHDAIDKNIDICCFDNDLTYKLTKEYPYNLNFGFRLIYGLAKILGSLDKVDFYGFNFLKENWDSFTYHYFAEDKDEVRKKEMETKHNLLDETNKLIEFIKNNRSS